VSGRSPSSLRRRLGGTLLVVGLVQLLVVTLALMALLQVRDDQRRVTDDLFASIQDSSAGYLSILEIEEAASAYLRSGEDEDLDRYQQAVAPRPDAASTEELQRRLAGAPAALAALSTVRESAVQWFGGLQPLIEGVQAQGPEVVTAADRAAEQQRFTDLTARYESYVDAILGARDQARDSLERSTTLLFTTVLLAVASAVIAGAVLYLALRRWVTRPLDALSHETRTVRGGDLEHVVAVDGPPEITGLGHDVEAMRRELVAQLAEVERSEARLERQAEELRRSNRDLEQFAYVASHDLQEPLRKVSSFCQMLERRYKGQLDERADQYIEFAVDGAKRMQLLINDLLAFSRVGRMSEGFTDVPLDDVLAEALRNLSVRVEESGAVVTADPLPVVPGDRRLLVQLLQNLVGNALKFAGDTGPRVRITAARRDGSWELAVCDEGIGIEPQYAERIFVIFQRLHAKAEYEGTGIGLALCKKIVEHHGGTIWLDTETPGQGTTFRFTLPTQAPATLPGLADDAPAGAREESAWTTA
jgi:signal transduction histidine kinase